MHTVALITLLVRCGKATPKVSMTGTGFVWNTWAKPLLAGDVVAPHTNRASRAMTGINRKHAKTCPVLNTVNTEAIPSSAGNRAPPCRATLFRSL